MLNTWYKAVQCIMMPPFHIIVCSDGHKGGGEKSLYIHVSERKSTNYCKDLLVASSCKRSNIGWITFSSRNASVINFRDICRCPGHYYTRLLLQPEFLDLQEKKDWSVKQSTEHFLDFTRSSFFYHPDSRPNVSHPCKSKVSFSFSFGFNCSC